MILVKTEIAGRSRLPGWAGDVFWGVVKKVLKATSFLLPEELPGHGAGVKVKLAMQGARVKADLHPEPRKSSSGSRPTSNPRPQVRASFAT